MKHPDEKPYYSSDESLKWHLDNCLAMLEKDAARTLHLRTRTLAKEYLRARLLDRLSLRPFAPGAALPFGQGARHIEASLDTLECEVQRVCGLDRQEARRWMRARIMSKPCRSQKPALERLSNG